MFGFVKSKSRRSHLILWPYSATKVDDAVKFMCCGKKAGSSFTTFCHFYIGSNKTKVVMEECHNHEILSFSWVHVTFNNSKYEPWNLRFCKNMTKYKYHFKCSNGHSKFAWRSMLLYYPRHLSVTFNIRN